MNPTDPLEDPQETTGRIVVGLFGDRSAAEAAIHDLTAAGFSKEQIGVATQEQSGTRDQTEEVGDETVGGTLVTVNAGVRTPEALAILRRHDVDFSPSRTGRLDP